jgi:ABC-type antimicrobial peptide transport system permease subunit
VAIVNQAFTRKFIKSGRPLEGSVDRALFGAGPKEPRLSIIGVVEDAVYRSLREGTLPTVYVPLAQRDDHWPQLAIGVRAQAGTSPAHLTRSIAAALSSVDRNLSVTFLPLAEYVRSDIVRERVLAMLSGFFGVLALLLASVGLYGVTSYGVSRRRREIGIRVALGAHVSTVVRLVLGRTALLVGLGLAIGLVVSFWASRFVGALLYGLQPRDATTMGTAVVVLATVGVIAAWLPARRAARIDPAQVLREG